MNAMCDVGEAAVSDDDLFAGLQQALHESFGAKQAIRRLVRQSSRYQSSYPLEELTVIFEGGEPLDLIFKNVSPRALSPTARRAKPGFLDDPRREISVYQTILAAAGLGTPRCYGAVMDDERTRYWLFLEKVAGQALYQIGAMKHWLSAARWLARFHQQFTCLDQMPPRTVPSLTRYDAPYYERWFNRAARFARDNTDSSRRAAIVRLAQLAPQIIKELLELPITLIHGEFYASNVLVNDSLQPIRVCPVDWERTAIGPGLIDLAALLAGSWPEEAKCQMAAAYHDELLCTGHTARSFEVLLRGLNLCRLMLAVQWLGWSPDWTPPNDHRHDWLAEALFIADLNQSG